MVRANLLGQAPYVADNVRILPDYSTTLDITMRTEAVQLAEVRVEAERPLLQKDATGTTRFLTSEDIQKLPTRGYRDAAAQQTGVVNFRLNIDNEAQNSPTLIVRGGRPNETAYYVDGFSQQDPLTGTSNTSISNNAIEEVVVLTGGFNPEYGRVMSGAVNVITREGTKDYFGALEAVTDVLSGDWVGAPKTDYNVYDASFGGPVIPGNEDLTFYVSGERRWQGDRNPAFMPDVFKSDLEDRGLSTDRAAQQQRLRATRFQGKLNWQPTDQLTFKAGGLGSQEDWRQFLNFVPVRPGSRAALPGPEPVVLRQRQPRPEQEDVLQRGGQLQPDRAQARRRAGVRQPRPAVRGGRDGRGGPRHHRVARTGSWSRRAATTARSTRAST